ncbi:hypothetical protein Y694_02649 [Methylibium sp. T29-B]|nr:hypothetical protein Y694_02649 [Methylibium sp. T29-B]
MPAGCHGRQIVAHALRAVDRQRVVDRVAAGAVGVADHAHLQRRVVGQAVGKAVEHGAQFGLDGRLAGVEGDVARHVELELVVGGARHVDAGALRGLLHRAALLFHLLGPHVAGHRAAQRADRRAGGRAFLAVADQHAGHRTDGRADAGALGGVLLLLAHVGAAAGQQRGRGERDDRERGDRGAGGGDRHGNSFEVQDRLCTARRRGRCKRSLQRARLRRR